MEGAVMKANIEELKHDPEVLLKQCERYLARVYDQVPDEVRGEWVGRLIESVIVKTKVA